jgi:hypothetical protein
MAPLHEREARAKDFNTLSKKRLQTDTHLVINAKMGRKLIQCSTLKWAGRGASKGKGTASHKKAAISRAKIFDCKLYSPKRLSMNRQQVSVKDLSLDSTKIVARTRWNVHTKRGSEQRCKNERQGQQETTRMKEHERKGQKGQIKERQGGKLEGKKSPCEKTKAYEKSRVARPKSLATCDNSQYPLHDHLWVAKLFL